jgi:hypothetical protein
VGSVHLGARDPNHVASAKSEWQAWRRKLGEGSMPLVGLDDRVDDSPLIY